MPITIFDSSKDFRPTCTITLHSDMIGNAENTNFDYKQNDANTISLRPFKLSELPQVSFSNSLDTNNGAKLAEKLAGFSEGKLFGIGIGEILQNNSISPDNKKPGENGFVPSILSGQSTYRVLKEAQKLSISLKTRIMYDKEVNPDKQLYQFLYDTLLRLCLPAAPFGTKSLIDSITRTLNGFYDTIPKVEETSPFTTIKSFGAATVAATKYVATGVNYMFEDEQDKRSELNKELNDMKSEFEKKNGAFGNNVQTDINALIGDYIYREYLTLDFNRNGREILTDITKNNSNKPHKFILKSFNVTQSNQLYDSTMAPVFMDFELELESLGVMIVQS